MASAASKKASAPRLADDDMAVSPAPKSSKHSQEKQCRFHKYFYALPSGRGGTSPQQLAFDNGDAHEHSTFVRADLHTEHAPFLYTSFKNNRAFIKHIKERYIQTLGGLRDCFYELIRFWEKIRTRLYIDAEWYTALGQFESDECRKEAEEERLERILALTTKILAERFGCPVTPRFAILEGGRPKGNVYKHSFHIIITNVFAHTNLDNRVIEHLSAELVLADDSDNGNGGHVIDPAVYSRNRHFRGPRMRKEKDGQPLMPYIFRQAERASKFTLAFVEKGTTFEYEMENTLIAWPVAEAEATPDFFCLTPFDVGTRFTKATQRKGSTTKSVSHRALRMTSAAFSEKGYQEEEEEEEEEDVRVALTVPDDLRELGTRILLFLVSDPYCATLEWNHVRKLEYVDETDTSIAFALYLADRNGHVCPKGVHHRGNSNHRIMLSVCMGTGDIHTRCFQSSTATDACLRWSRVGSVSIEGVVFQAQPQALSPSKEPTLQVTLAGGSKRASEFAPKKSRAKRETRKVKIALPLAKK